MICACYYAINEEDKKINPDNLLLYGTFYTKVKVPKKGFAG